MDWKGYTERYTGRSNSDGAGTWRAGFRRGGPVALARRARVRAPDLLETVAGPVGSSTRSLFEANFKMDVATELDVATNQIYSSWDTEPQLSHPKPQARNLGKVVISGFVLVDQGLERVRPTRTMHVH